MILPDDKQTKIRAAAIIRRGGIIAFRTDTFYGLGVDPFNETAVHALKKLKGREAAKPILVLLADTAAADRFIVERSELFARVCEHHWPGPLTLIGKARSELPDELTSTTRTIGVRLPNDTRVQELIRVCGGALTGTSANLSGQPAARTAQEVENYFSSRIDLIIDSGEVVVEEPSTVLDLSDAEPRLVREGAISLKDLRASLSPASG